MASAECERLLTKPLSVEEILGVEPQRESIRGPPLNRAMEPGQAEEVEVYTDGSCAKNACLMDQAGYGVFFPASGLCLALLALECLPLPSTTRSIEF